MSRLGVVAASRREAAPLLQAADADGTCVDVETSGIGPARAARAAHRLIGRHAAALVSWGLAGGLARDLAPGDLLVPAEVIGPDGRRFPVDPAWRARLLARLGAGAVARQATTLASSRTLLASPDEKRDLRARVGAGGVDMESAAVAGVAAAAGLPFLAVRAICDPASLALSPEVLAAVGPSGGLRPVRLMAALARHPSRWPAMIRLGRAERRARARLETVVRRAGPRLEAP